MNLLRITPVLLLFSLSVSAQEDYSQLDIGWKQLIDPKSPTKPEKFDMWSYSPEQMRLANVMLSWIQQTYTPRGCLGIGRRLGNQKPNEYDSTYAAEPLRYGAIAKFHTELRKDANGKWNPYTNTHFYMRIAANGNIGENLKLISTPEHHYFMIPNINEGESDYEARANIFGFKKHPMLARYPHFFSPNQDAWASGYTVVMSQGRGLPYHVIPKGEYLQRLKESLARLHAEELAKINRDDSKAKNEFLKTENTNYAERMAAYDRLVTKYKDRMNEPAVLASRNGTIYLENDKGNDMFTSTSGAAGYPVYAFDADKVAKCKSDKPQWIAITWVAAREDYAYEMYFMKTIMERFDFDYVYNYFFDPEKVKGRDYAPLGPDPVSAASATASVKPAAKEPGMFFTEDFSGVATGQMPVNWSSSYSIGGGQPTAVALKGQPGAWLKIAGQSSVWPKDMADPLPNDFELSFELGAPKDITWGTKAFEFRLHKNANRSDETVLLRIRAGFSGRPGEFTLDCSANKSEYLSVRGEAVGFSNDKDPNIIRVRLVKKGTSLECFFNDISVAKGANAVPAGTIFHKLSFGQANSDNPEVQHYYLSRIRVRPL